MHTGLPVTALAAGLAIALGVAAFTDVTRRQIDNVLNGAIALGAPLFWWATGLTLWPQVAMQVALAFAVLVVLAGLFALRAMGGGDVKLLTALALWLPWAMFLRLAMLTALLGGALSLVMGMWHLSRRRKDALQIPYGVAIAGAGLWTLGTSGWFA